MRSVRERERERERDRQTDRQTLMKQKLKKWTLLGLNQRHLVLVPQCSPN